VSDMISTDLKAVMRRLRLGKLIDTLPERLALARQQKMPHQDFLFGLLSDECQRRDSAASTLRSERALLDPTAKVTYDEALLAELVSLRFIEAHRHAAIVGPVGVGKTFIAHALGHIACRRGFNVLVLRADRLLKLLKHARLDHSYEAELRKLLSIDVLVIDDFCLDAMDTTESRDMHEILTERDRIGSVIITSNRGPDEWLATFADPIRAQAAIDRFTSNAYDLVIDGESYRKRLKPKSPDRKAGQKNGGSGK
jgi:DNA replication protein DnaC